MGTALMRWMRKYTVKPVIIEAELRSTTLENGEVEYEIELWFDDGRGFVGRLERDLLLSRNWRL